MLKKLIGNYSLYDRVQLIVMNASYKPGGEFIVSEYASMIVLRYTEPRTDASDFNGPMLPMNAQVGYSTEFLAKFSDVELEDFMKQALFNLVRDLEFHEVKEFFKYNNVHLHHPHPELL